VNHCQPHPVPGLESLIGADVEARSINGSVTRGRLLEVGDGFLIVEKSTTRRRTFVALAHLVALVDETAPGLSKRERTELAGEAERGGE
jgi:hypothetical protein